MTHAGVPVLLLETPSSRIVAASPEALALLHTEPAELVGRLSRDFLVDPDPGIGDLIAAGRVHAVEISRGWRLPDGRILPIDIWIRALDVPEPDTDPPQRLVAAVARARDAAVNDRPPIAATVGTRTMFGTIGGDLLLERVSADSGLLGSPSGEVIGQPFLRLLEPAAVADALAIVAQALHEDRGVCQVVRAVTADGLEPAHLFVVPLKPGPDLLFALAFTREAVARHTEPSPEEALIAVFDGLNALNSSAVLALLGRANLPGQVPLTQREADIVARMLAGDRGPSIARRLGISESTVRNTLSTVYQKLGVASQQELLDLFRETAHQLGQQGDRSD